MFYEYVNILNKGDILIILVSGFSIFPHQKKYLLMRIFYVKVKQKHILQCSSDENMHGRNEHLMTWIRKK